MLTLLLLHTTMPHASATRGRGSKGENETSRDRFEVKDEDRKKAKSKDRVWGRERTIKDSYGADLTTPKDNYKQVQDTEGTSGRYSEEGIERGTNTNTWRDRIRNRLRKVKDRFRGSRYNFQKHITRFAALAAMLKIELVPITLERIIQQARSDVLISRLTENNALMEEYGIRKLTVYATELDTILKKYNRQIETADISEAAKVLSDQATDAALAQYNEAKFDGLTREESREKLSEVTVGDYYLTRSMFRKLPNQVAIRGEGGKVEVIPGAQYTTNMVTLNHEEMNDRLIYSQIRAEKFQPILDILDRWKIELKDLKRKNVKIPNVYILNKIRSLLQINKLPESMHQSDEVLIATSTYNGEMQAITIITVDLKNPEGQCYIEFTFTAPHNILAGEGTLQGAANYLTSSGISYVFDKHEGVSKVCAEIVNLFNVKSGRKLGFSREKKKEQNSATQN